MADTAADLLAVRAAQRFGRRRNGMAGRLVVSGPGLTGRRSGRRSGGSLSSTPAATACACRSASPVTCRRWSWPLPERRAPQEGARSRSRSARPVSTSPMCSPPSAATRPSTGGQPELGLDFTGVITAVGPGVTDLPRRRERRWFRCRTAAGARSSPATRAWWLALPAGLTGRAGRRGLHRLRHRLVRPVRPGPYRGRRPRANPLRDGRCRPGRHRDRQGTPGPTSSRPRAARSRRQLLRSMGIEHVYDSRFNGFRRRRSVATPTGTA